MTGQSAEPLPLERARLLLGWLRAQRAVDACLSTLLAAGPGGERRVSGDIDRVGVLVAAAADAFEAYRNCVHDSQDSGRARLPNVGYSPLGTVSPIRR